MKNLKNNGFTLIELLAVITIMGILMMVAIPSVSRTIENSRRDTFADVALEYIDTVRNSVLADELTCYKMTSGAKTIVTGDTGSTYASLPDGAYVMYISTGESYAPTIGTVNVNQNTLDLMESGGTSSWGGNDVYGYVYWVKKTQTNGNIKSTYSIILQDSAKHGMADIKTEKEVKRAAVSSTIATAKSALTSNKVTVLTGASDTVAVSPTSNTPTVNYVCGLS
jgi:prepilin-type N-terminal cleavage/methylation domain-containing protein